VPRVYTAPEHVAPERFGAVDAATDIYGLSVIGYELLTGRPPVHDDGTVRPVGDVVDRVPDGLSTVLTKSLKPAKMERYASAAAFKRELTAEDNDA
jgi:serine/threonine protein kinase